MGNRISNLLRHTVVELLECRLCLSTVAFASRNIVTSESLAANHLVAADVDSDGDIDFVSTGNRVAWHENDGDGNFSDEQSIAHQSAISLAVGDVDGDGDLDVVVHHRDDTIVWYKNLDGAGTFGDHQLIADEPAIRLTTFDVDGDGDLDILSAFLTKSAWYENTDGQGTFGGQKTILADKEVRAVATADMDGDGDTDLVSAIYDEEHGLTWQENTDGNGTFGPAQVIPSITGSGRFVATVDMDGDGHLDVVFASNLGIAWHKNTDDGIVTAPRAVSNQANFIHSIAAADIDGDGDVDLVATRSFGGVDWYENVDGGGMVFDEHRVKPINGPNTPQSIAVEDIDGDWDMDLVFSARMPKIGWYEQRIVGDGDDNKAFDSSDLVAVFQGGKYEDGIDNNANFDEGDWNQDGDFDSGDLVLAFQAGHYEAAQIPRASQVVAAIDLAIARDDFDPKKPQAFVP